MFDLRENNPVLGETHFHVYGFTRRLDLTQQEVTRKWPRIMTLGP